MVIAFAVASAVTIRTLQAARVIDGQVLAAAVGVILLGVVAASLPWWRALDEAAREAHKSAAYWGGLVALVVMGYAAVSANLAARASLWQLAALWLNPGPQAAGVAAGATLSALLFTACYGASWMAWWLRRR